MEKMQTEVKVIKLIDSSTTKGGKTSKLLYSIIKKCESLEELEVYLWKKNFEEVHAAEKDVVLPVRLPKLRRLCI